MSRRAFLQLATHGIAGFALGGLARRATGQDNPDGRPNILFIMADDHTSQAWGCYGSRLAPYARTGHIDRLARDGALLRNCFCTNSICVPSRAAILTGQYSHVNGVKTLADGLDPEADTVAKRLRDAGYDTAVIGKWHLKNEPAGFTYYNVLRGQGDYLNPTLFEIGHDWKRGGRKHEGHSTDIITDLCLSWLRTGRKPDKPFCLMCHFKAVHEPFYSHDRYRGLYEGEAFPEPEDLGADRAPRHTVVEGWPLEILAERYRSRPGRYPPPALQADETDPRALRRATYRKFIADYLRTVAGINDNVGRLLAFLDETGLARNTVVVYTSDQGYFLGEHNLFDKRFMLEESLRMPFVVRYPPEIPPGTVTDDIILNIDFPELMLDYAGAEIPDTMQGRSFRRNLAGKTPPDWRDAMYYRYWADDPRRPAHYGIRTKTHKLIVYYGLMLRGKPREECREFYDLTTDPGELENRIGDPRYAETVAVLEQQLADLRRELGDTAAPA